MFSHVTVGTAHLAKAVAFHDAILHPPGLERRAVAPDGGPEAACWASPHRSLHRGDLPGDLLALPRASLADPMRDPTQARRR